MQLCYFKLSVTDSVYILKCSCHLGLPQLYNHKEPLNRCPKACRHLGILCQLSHVEIRIPVSCNQINLLSLLSSIWAIFRIPTAHYDHSIKWQIQKYPTKLFTDL